MLQITMRIPPTQGSPDKPALTMQGHAAFAPAGQDIVCAAASMLAYTAAERLRELADEGAVQALACRMEPGDLRIAFCQPMPDGRVEALFDTLAPGFRLLAARYPAHVCFSEK